VTAKEGREGGRDSALAVPPLSWSTLPPFNPLSFRLFLLLFTFRNRLFLTAAGSSPCTATSWARAPEGEGEV